MDPRHRRITGNVALYPIGTDHIRVPRKGWMLLYGLNDHKKRFSYSLTGYDDTNLRGAGL